MTGSAPAPIRAVPDGGTHGPPPATLAATGVSVGYDDRLVCRAVDVEVVRGSYTAVIGPNACGKSTLLRALARLLRPSAGHVVLDGRDIASYRPRELATRLGLLPQTSLAPDGIRVADLVARGRHPHQGMFDRWSAEDERAVVAALEATGVTELSGRLVDELSGGQRQRVWVSMALAQETSVLLLDEPTTFLDVAHQYGLLELFEDLRTDHGRTIVVVLHDLNQAARYADHVVMMKDGEVVRSGPPAEVVTEELVEHVYGLRCRVVPDPETGTPLVVPRRRTRG
ncbi:ABC-type cobalamin/Fe3+-siderophores transport system ATPase subunit [Nocardioides zeae]|uniref:ABC-type cobalamin/Fe3+-siderophores transport system ATPase subunit n=1 Tax=Nocardioides zeae TaxID=1457234 RepID=A0ACC6ILX8_9ACTN|nr:ABC transporter ATP-binding protein [Nocardioides zeae]MDR6175090.1 ABC-type cobalamin/Fe3+-siderophores transport system ATPase subunit [Nocardioides zeae]MDR6211668.1 ABC-type cobalamin/Fe3+-siderophores transport system ATPase subunit [Nocardioides zeae]